MVTFLVIYSHIVPRKIQFPHGSMQRQSGQSFGNQILFSCCLVHFKTEALGIIYEKILSTMWKCLLF